MSFSKSKAVGTKMQTILKLDLCKFNRGSSLLQLPNQLKFFAITKLNADIQPYRTPTA